MILLEMLFFTMVAIHQAYCRLKEDKHYLSNATLSKQLCED
jgi:hypothetical protein